MSFLNTSSHQKFIAQCNSLISGFPQNNEAFAADERAEELKTDLEKLKKLAESYFQKFTQLPELSREYYLLQRRIRINMRKLQIGKSTALKKSRKSAKEDLGKQV